MLVREVHELDSSGPGEAEVLDDVLVGDAGLVEGVVAGTGIEEGVGEASSDAVVGYVEMFKGELATPEGSVIITEEVILKWKNDSLDLSLQGCLDGVGEPMNLHFGEKGDLGIAGFCPFAGHHNGEIFAIGDPVYEVDGWIIHRFIQSSGEVCNIGEWYEIDGDKGFEVQ